MTKLIVGLGNPGKKYDNTRHNVGFMTLESFLDEHGFNWKKNENDQRYSSLNLDGHRFIALEPLTYMNESGRAVKYICEKFSIESENILVIHDDMDLATGKIRIKVEHSPGGHNGVKDIMRVLGGKEFVNLKIGTDHPENGNVINWVLGRFSVDESPKIDEAIKISSEIIASFIKGTTVDELMNKFN
ncbi:aminoacyl-tRNA hydrolase [Xylocopilactobacillus apicola]|uniref:Peptidyl-tRNA hydrolase n=1 Tax=Xylocopilactobacillus apicola TaxID=2932184 RepID=A0AAU9D7H3_9LACO|nr:aminoacyl-tRNA hydrolase [Xylocopilactobacillus apicola]BDR58331.1 peptidyl-tRNA hydrolase [Xylocopilactobacillus apicola]